MVLLIRERQRLLCSLKNKILPLSVHRSLSSSTNGDAIFQRSDWSVVMILCLLIYNMNNWTTSLLIQITSEDFCRYLLRSSISFFYTISLHLKCITYCDFEKTTTHSCLSSESQNSFHYQPNRNFKWDQNFYWVTPTSKHKGFFFQSLSSTLINELP